MWIILIENYENLHYWCRIHNGSYDGDRNEWIGMIDRSTLPAFEIADCSVDEYGDYYYTGRVYGIALIIHDLNDDYCYYYDLGQRFYFDGNSLTDGYEYEMGIEQMVVDNPADPDEEIPNVIEGAYFFHRNLFTNHELGLIVYE